jgi:predicted anti-sigma-YlaC factor YlaD
VVLPLILALAVMGCSVKGMAMNSMADALSGGGTSVYMTDNDPALVGDALPFSLKLMEMVLEETPEHEGLLVSTAMAFVLYGQAWVMMPAQRLEATDLQAARAERLRGKALFLRGLGYAGRALELRKPGVVSQFYGDSAAAIPRLEEDDIPAMFWYATALVAAISADRNDMDLVLDLPLVSLLLNRALELDEDWNKGAIHERLIPLTISGPDGGPEVAEAHMERAMELNGGTSVGPLVSFAESVCVQEQDRARFNDLLTQVLAFDVDAHPDNRLANVIAQQHAAWLMSRVDELFFMQKPRPRETFPGRR